ncbi:hypothetical protein CFIO01_13678 [Colletotrichum fioriniae PJ7]|uniref:Uncharacterized protein n=1 Tax=Colletotrichum fioriniae PJ7 TaxID=1445577 RepID=A0A010QA18_9PEZI|nr:hypothetical protein CFIO01_13678 [Colletotrichum fioriniae PJ7]
MSSAIGRLLQGNLLEPRIVPNNEVPQSSESHGVVGHSRSPMPSTYHAAAAGLLSSAVGRLPPDTRIEPSVLLRTNEGQLSPDPTPRELIALAQPG